MTKLQKKQSDVLSNFPKKARVLFIDIETSPVIAYVWGSRMYNVDVTPDKVVEDSYLLSFAAKWIDSKEIIYDDQSSARFLYDDSRLLKEIRKLLDKADIVVAQNGQAFDIPYIRSRMACAGIPPPSPFRQVDTYREAKKHFGFTFNKLEFLAEALHCPVKKSLHKEFPGMELWRECLARNKRAWRVMKGYNIDDVRALEEVYLKLRPWIEGHPNIGVYVDSDEPVCPRCGGDVMKRGYRATQMGIYHNYHCKKCFGYSRGKTSILEKKRSKRQLVN
jgi:predicted RNA-binding Zn-ribbon protein involved in translation (DUF1610 family)